MSILLLLTKNFLKIKVLILFYVCFYVTILLQAVTTYDLKFLIFFFYVGVFVLGLLPFNVGLCNKQFRNSLLDAAVFSLIFLSSAFCYFKALKAKLQSLRGDIYALLSKLQTSLEAKIALIQANEGAQFNTTLKTLCGLVLVIGVGLFVYWWFFSGGGGSGPKDPKDPSDSTSSPGSGGGSNDIIGAASNASTADTSIAEPVLNVANVIQSPLPLDYSVVDAVSSSVITTLGLMKRYKISITETKALLTRFRYSINEFKDILDTNLSEFNSRTPEDKLAALEGIIGGLENVQCGLEVLTVANADEIRVNDLQREELHHLAERLLKLLESQPDFSAMNDNEFPALCSVGLFFHMLTQGAESISAFESTLIHLKGVSRKWLCLANKYYPPNLKDAVKKVVKDLLKEIDSFLKRCNFWSDISKSDEHTSAAEFFNRFEGLCKNL